MESNQQKTDMNPQESGTDSRKTYTYAEFVARGKELFGDDRLNWRFVCPSCGHVQSKQDYESAEAPESAVGFSCVGRWLENPKQAFGHDGGPCNYAGGGLFMINPVTVILRDGHRVKVFAFEGDTEEEPEQDEVRELELEL